MDRKAYTLTSGGLARGAGCTTVTVNKYAAQGLLDHLVASNGVRLFSPDAVERVQELLAQAAENRFRRRA